MNYGDHNFIEITQQTKLRVEPVELDKVELCCSTMSTQPNAWTGHVERVESSRAKWNLGLSEYRKPHLL